MNGAAKWIGVAVIACTLGALLFFYKSGTVGTVSIGTSNPASFVSAGGAVNSPYKVPMNPEPVENENTGSLVKKFSKASSQSPRMSDSLGTAATKSSQQTKFPAGSKPQPTALESVWISGPSPSGGAAGPAREISIPVPEGSKVPAVFFDAEDKPLPQQKALDHIAEEFERNVSEVPPGVTQEEVWEAARRIADERYLTLFGYQAYSQYHIQAAKEALKEKKGISTTP